MLARWRATLATKGKHLSCATNTATRQHGVDVVAERWGSRLGVEVKGYPSLFPVAGPKKGRGRPRVTRIRLLSASLKHSYQPSGCANVCLNRCR